MVSDVVAVDVVDIIDVVDVDGITFNAPQLIPEPPSTLNAISGQGFNYTFGTPFDKDGDKVTLTVDLGIAASFI